MTLKQLLLSGARPNQEPTKYENEISFSKIFFRFYYRHFNDDKVVQFRVYLQRLVATTSTFCVNLQFMTDLMNAQEIPSHRHAESSQIESDWTGSRGEISIVESHGHFLAFGKHSQNRNFRQSPLNKQSIGPYNNIPSKGIECVILVFYYRFSVRQANDNATSHLTIPVFIGKPSKKSTSKCPNRSLFGSLKASTKKIID